MTAQIALAGGSAADEEEAAAAIAAVLALLEDEAAASLQPEQPAVARGWHATARLIVQGMVPARLPVAPTWGRIERLRRAARGGGGIVGQ